MEPRDTFGDQSSSDVIVRLRNEKGLDNWIYCHSKILTKQSKYFSDRLSNPCKILDSRNSVELVCPELDYDHHINLLKLLYRDHLSEEDNLFESVSSALGILRVAKELSCSQIVITCCVNYLEAVPWTQLEEKEILKIIPRIGSEEAASVLARLQSVDQSVVSRIFVSAFRFVTSSPSLSDIKTSLQEKIDNMLPEDEDDDDEDEEDEDPPILIVDEPIKLEVKDCVKSLFVRFSLCLEEEVISRICIVLSDLLWTFQILTKIELCRDFVITWIDTSEKLVNVVESMGTVSETVEIRLKVIEVFTKVLESVGYGFVILPTLKRFQMVKLWIPFLRNTKPLVDDEAMRCRISGNVWQTLEASLVALIEALPSSDQAEVLTEWLSKKEVYPDLTDVFEFWCCRIKVAKRRLSLLEG